MERREVAILSVCGESCSSEFFEESSVGGVMVKFTIMYNECIEKRSF